MNALLPLALDGASARLVLAGLFVTPSDERLQALRGACADVDDWTGVVRALERHGVLGLVARNLRAAGARLPEDVTARLDEREASLREDARRFRLTLERFLVAAQAERIQPTLLKGASLALDTYPEPTLRGQGDLDLLVEPHELDAAVRAGAAAGLLAGADALPLFWYRRTHFHFKLRPTSVLLREVELHWALQHPSLLLTPDAAALRARRRANTVAGVPVFVLDELDRLVHLATHLVSHAGGIPGEPTQATLASVLADVTHPLRLKWIVDVRAELERLGETLDPDALSERAREWNAAPQLAWTLRWVRAALGLLPSADAVTERTLAKLGPARSNAVPSPLPRDDGPLATLDFRASALRRLPAWFWPPRAYLERRYHASPPAVRRAAHAATVAARVAESAVLFPLALAGRALLTGRRRRALRSTESPDAVLDLAARWRELSRREGAEG